MSIEVLQPNTKNQKKLMNKTLKTTLALALSSGLLAACANTSSASKGGSGKSVAHSSLPKSNKDRSSQKPTKTTANNTSQNNSIGTPITNLCNLSTLNTLADTIINTANGPVSCTDTSSAANPDALAIANWSQAGSTQLLVSIVPNDQTQSSIFGPPESNVWAHDIAGISSNSSEQLIPSAIDGQPAIWLDQSLNYGGPTITEKGVEFKYGAYIIGSVGIVPTATEAQYIQVDQLVKKSGFSR